MQKGEKTPMARFLFEESRRHERAAKAARDRERDAEVSRKLQEEVEKLASTLWAGRDDDTARLLREGIKAMQERDKMRLKADLYDEADHYLTRAGYGYPSGVENMPTVAQMAEHALNHRSQIQGHCHAALTHLGVSEEWMPKIYGGHMQEFFEAHGQEQSPFGPTKRIHCACGIYYDVTSDIPPEDVPGLCPKCGGDPFGDNDKAPDLDTLGTPEDLRERYAGILGTPEDLRERHADLDARAREATDMEERALADFTSAIEEVRGKLAEAVGVPDDGGWEDLVPAVEKLATDLANQKAESANVFMVVNLTREHMWKIREVAAKALGEEVPETTGDEHTALRYVERLIETLKTLRREHDVEEEEWGEEQDQLRGTIEKLREEVQVLQQGDDTQSGTWRGHFLDLARTVGVPALVSGNVRSPNVDAVMTYVGQVMPAYKLAQRVEAIEERLKGSDAAPGRRLKPGTSQTCSKCGTAYPIGTIFCPNCGRESP